METTEYYLNMIEQRARRVEHLDREISRLEHDRAQAEQWLAEAESEYAEAVERGDVPDPAIAWGLGIKGYSEACGIRE